MFRKHELIQNLLKTICKHRIMLGSWFLRQFQQYFSYILAVTLKKKSVNIGYIFVCKYL